MSTTIAEPSVRPSRASVWRSEGAQAPDWPFEELLRADFRVERRRNPRWKVAGHATLLGLGPALGLMVELDELDGSPWWIGGSAISAVPEGTKVSVGFSDPNGRPAQGVVMRCEKKRDDRYRIAIRFEQSSIC